MSIVKVKVKKTHPNAELPSKVHSTDYCYDLKAVKREEIAPDTYRYSLGLCLQVDDNMYNYLDFQNRKACFKIYPRSSAWKKGMVLANSVGIVDIGYTGEVTAVFHHINKAMPIYGVGEFVCQMAFSIDCELDFVEVDELKQYERGNGREGSTDSKRV